MPAPFQGQVTRSANVGKRWDQFVERHPAPNVAQLSAWGRIAQRAYGHDAVYLTAEEDGDIAGVLPLVMMRSRIFGRRLVSMPYLDYGGLLVDPERTGVSRALVDAALDIARDMGATGVGLHQVDVLDLPYPATDDRVTMLLDLESEEKVWKALPSERRNRVRKGEKNGLVPEWCGAEGLDAFYQVWAVNMRDLGSPVHSRTFFSTMMEELPGTARVLLVRDRDGRTVGGAMCLVFRDSVAVHWVSSLREAFNLCPNFVLYWEAIRFACRSGYRVLDFGRSVRNGGTFEFKRQWGATAHPLPWLFVDVVPGGPPPVDQDHRRFDRMIALWKRIPVPVANVIGPWIRGQVPN